MRSFFENKTWVLLASILALGALTVLSVSLKNVSFNDAQPIGRGEASSYVDPPLVSRQALGEVSLWSQILLLGVFALLIALVAMLLSPEGRKRMLRLIVRMLATFAAVYFLIKRYPEVLSNLLLNFHVPAVDKQTQSLADVPPPIFTPPQPSPFIAYAVSVVMVLVMIYLAWRLYRTWSELNPPRQKSLTEIARVIRSSLHDLSSGRDSTDVILNCYFRMSDAVSDKKNMRRESSMTPAEFAARLEQSGLPGDAVRRLTRLFEGVRYGSQKTGPKDINEAVACLTTILQYCGESV